MYLLKTVIIYDNKKICQNLNYLRNKNEKSHLERFILRYIIIIIFVFEGLLLYDISNFIKRIRTCV